MINALLRIRFRALFAGLTRQGLKTKTGKKKSGGKGSVILLSVLYLYVAVVLCGFMGFLFWSLAEPYHMLNLDWLYFAMSGTMGLGFAVIGSVFTTQSQLYDAKDNDMLLAMPIPPGNILLSRILPLLAMNLLFSGIVMVPAMAVYAVTIRFSIGLLLAQLLSLILVSLLAQAIACILGWGLHLLLSRMNKSAASVIYMVVFLGIYFTVYPQMNQILASMATNGEAIAGTIQTWVWPMYAMGQGAAGSIGYLLAFAAISAAVFALIYWLLSVTFLHTATAKRSGKKRRLDMKALKTASVGQAIVHKELRRFLGCPVYLTNMGIGLVMLPALTVAGVVFRGTLLTELGEALPLIAPYIGMIVCAALLFCSSMVSISAPSISLEGKYLWILKSMPISAREILKGKLNFHCLLSAPLAAVCGLVLAIAYGCPLPEILLCAVIPAAVMVLSGLLGLLCNLKWPRFDWISEAYPCKQAAPVAIVMFSLMGLPLLLGAGYILLSDFLTPSIFMAIAAAAILLAVFGLYRVLITWGAKKWNML